MSPCDLQSAPNPEASEALVGRRHCAESHHRSGGSFTEVGRCATPTAGPRAPGGGRRRLLRGRRGCCATVGEATTRDRMDMTDDPAGETLDRHPIAQSRCTYATLLNKRSGVNFVPPTGGRLGGRVVPVPAVAPGLRQGVGDDLPRPSPTKPPKRASPKAAPKRPAFCRLHGPRPLPATAQMAAISCERQRMMWPNTEVSRRSLHASRRTTYPQPPRASHAWRRRGLRARVRGPEDEDAAGRAAGAHAPACPRPGRWLLSAPCAGRSREHGGPCARKALGAEMAARPCVASRRARHASTAPSSAIPDTGGM